MNDTDRPLRAKVLEWVSSEDRTTQESGIGLSAIIEAMDAGFESLRRELERMRGVG